MAVTVISTPGATDANSYQDVSEVDDYFLKRVPSSISEQWYDLDTSEKIAAVLMATQWTEALIHWSHFPTTQYQSLQWPQYGQWMRNGWTMVPDDIIPQEL